jgi:hypothetical protein
MKLVVMAHSELAALRQEVKGLDPELLAGRELRALVLR